MDPEFSERESLDEILSQLRSGDAGARDRLFGVVYEELRRIARRQMRGERLDHTLQTTALVHEAYLRLTRGKRLDSIQNRRHFFGAAAQVMRQLLIDHARHRRALKRHPPGDQLVLDSVLDHIETTHHVEFLDLNDALGELSSMGGRQSEIVQLRFFGGLTVPEVAEQLEVSVSTIEKEYASARAWLNLRLG